MKTNQALLVFFFSLMLSTYSCNQTMVKSETVLQLMKSLFNAGSKGKSTSNNYQNE